MRWKASLLSGLASLAVLAGCETIGMSSAEVAAREQRAARVAELRRQYPDDPDFFRRNIGDTVRFATGSSVLSPEARARLRHQAQWLGVNYDYHAVIEGYADERGPRGYNMPLAARRSQAIADHLVSLGLPRERLRSVTFGVEDPTRLCRAPDCLAENRRGVTVLVRADLL